jgi:Tfp pilus assembly protein PilE
MVTVLKIATQRAETGGAQPGVFPDAITLRGPMSHVATRTRPEQGFALLELMLATAVIVVGSMAMFTTLITTGTVSQEARQQSLARDEAMGAVETFRAQCGANFAAGITEFNNRTVPTQILSTRAGRGSVHTRIALDETTLVPPMDLNGNGTALDRNLTPAQLRVAYLTTTVTWPVGNKTRSISLDTVLAATEASALNAAGGAGGAGAPVTPSTVSLVSKTVSAQQLVATIRVGDAPMNVAGMTIQSSRAAYVSEIKINNNVVWSKPTGAPPTGSMIITQPFSMNLGNQTINWVKFMNGPNGGTANVTGSNISIVFHTEGGDRVVVIQ